MPLVLAGIAHAVAGAIISMLLRVLENPVFIRKVLLLTAEKAVKMTDTDLDDKLLEAAKQILEVGANGADNQEV